MIGGPRLHQSTLDLFVCCTLVLCIRHVPSVGFGNIGGCVMGNDQGKGEKPCVDSAWAEAMPGGCSYLELAQKKSYPTRGFGTGGGTAKKKNYS